MAVSVLEDRAVTVEFTPPVRPASATCTLYDPAGNSLGVVVVTVDSFAGSVAAVTDATSFTVTVSAGTAAVGRRYWFVSASAGAHESLIRLGQLSSTAWTIETPPATSAVVATDLIKGARLTVPLTATHTATRGQNFRLEWIVTGVDSIVYIYPQMVHVVRQFFRAPVLVDEAARYLSMAFPGRAAVVGAGYYRELAERASERVERKLRATERWPWLVGDQGVFADCGVVALRIELAQEGLVPPGFDPSQYRRQQEDELGMQFTEAIAQVWIDGDDDGAVNASTEQSHFGNVSLVRA